MSTVPFALMWGPGFTGNTVGLALYGIGVGQFIFYMRAFPHDTLPLKVLVLIVFLCDSAQTFAATLFHYHIFIECRLNTSPNCLIYVPLLVTFGGAIMYWITFMVQSFYAHRVWIISGHNRVLTSAVILSTLAQLVLGSMLIADSILTPTYQAMYTLKYLPMAAVASAVCDAIITGSIFYYLMPGRTGVARRGNYIKKLNAVFVQMGLFSFINASAMMTMYYIQGEAGLLTAVPGVILSKTYMNSMLSVLNARKPIREELQAQAERTIEIPTLPTIR